MFYLHKQKTNMKKNYPVMSCETLEEAWMIAYQNRFYYDDIQVTNEEKTPYITFIKGEMIIPEGQQLEPQHTFLSDFVEEQKKQETKRYTYLIQEDWSSTSTPTKKRGKTL